MTVNVNYPLPTVHLNGTSRDMLLKGEMKVHDAIQKVFDALGECEFHGRDYYVQDPMSVLTGWAETAFQQAHKERMKHIENLRAFQQYSLEHVMHLRDSE
jgi:hypothetical protein